MNYESKSGDPTEWKPCPRCGGDHFMCSDGFGAILGENTPPEPKPGERDLVTDMKRWAYDVTVIGAAKVKIIGWAHEVEKLQARVVELEQKLDASEKNLQCWTADLQESLRVSEARVAELEAELREQHELANAAATAMTQVVDESARRKARVVELEKEASHLRECLIKTEEKLAEHAPSFAD